MYMKIDAYVLHIIQKTSVSWSPQDGTIWSCIIEYRLTPFSGLLRKPSHICICHDTQVLLW